jgi:hypothetical protein
MKNFLKYHNRFRHCTESDFLIDYLGVFVGFLFVGVVTFVLGIFKLIKVVPFIDFIVFCVAVIPILSILMVILGNLGNFIADYYRFKKNKALMDSEEWLSDNFCGE